MPFSTEENIIEFKKCLSALETVDSDFFEIKNNIIGDPLDLSMSFFNIIFTHLFGFQWLYNYLIKKGDHYHYDPLDTTIDLPTIEYSYSGNLSLDEHKYVVTKHSFWIIPFNYIFLNVGKLIGILFVLPWILPVNIFIGVAHYVKKKIISKKIEKLQKEINEDDLCDALLSSDISKTYRGTFLAQQVDLDDFLNSATSLIAKKQRTCEILKKWIIDNNNKWMELISLGNNCNKLCEAIDKTWVEDKQKELNETYSKKIKEYQELCQKYETECFSTEPEFKDEFYNLANILDTHAYYRRNPPSIKLNEKILNDPFKYLDPVDHHWNGQGSMQYLMSSTDLYLQSVIAQQSNDRRWSIVSIVLKSIILTPFSLLFTIPKFLKLRRDHHAEILILNRFRSDISGIKSGNESLYSCGEKSLRQLENNVSSKETFNPYYAFRMQSNVIKGSEHYNSAMKKCGVFCMSNGEYSDANEFFSKVDSADIGSMTRIARTLADNPRATLGNIISKTAENVICTQRQILADSERHPLLSEVQTKRVSYGCR